MPSVRLTLPAGATEGVSVTRIVDGWTFRYELAPGPQCEDDTGTPENCADVAKSHVVEPAVNQGVVEPHAGSGCATRDGTITVTSLLGFAYKWRYAFGWCYDLTHVWNCFQEGADLGTGIGYTYEGESTSTMTFLPEGQSLSCLGHEVGKYRHRSSLTIPDNIPLFGGQKLEIVTHPTADGTSNMHPDGAAAWTIEGSGNLIDR